jgi:hypothetical protein
MFSPGHEMAICAGGTKTALNRGKPCLVVIVSFGRVLGPGADSVEGKVRWFPK